ncbi:MAG: hypothetical protein WD250_12640 [Egibacteraceae bacterium]
MRRDIGKSVLLGPLRLAVPSLGYLALYPLLLRRYGVEVVGLWGLISALSTVIAVADIGFSQLLRREVNPRTDHSTLRERRADHSCAQGLYLLLLAAGFVVLLLSSPAISDAVKGVYPAPALVGALLVLMAASALQLILQLDDAVLSGLQDAAFTHGVRALTPILMVAGALGGALTGVPIEGLSAGTFVANAVGLALLRRRLHRHHPQWAAAETALSRGEWVRQTARTARRGWHFYSIAIGSLVREPLARVIVAFMLGLPGVAVWDVAMRVTRVARDLITAGLTVLYPSLASLSQARDRAEMVRLMQLTLILVAIVGGSSLGLLIGTAGLAIPLLFPTLGQGAPTTTQVLAIWNLITLLNVPFWYALQATGFERHAAWSVWAHTASLGLLVILAAPFSFTVVSVALYWTVSAVVTQVLIFGQVHRQLGLFWPVLRAASVRGSLVGSVVLVAGAFLARPAARLLEHWGAPTTAATVAYLALLFGLFWAFAWRHSWPPVSGFIADVRNPAPPHEQP